MSANLQPDTEHRVWKWRDGEEEGAVEGECSSSHSSRQLDRRQHRGANPTSICGPSRSGTGEETGYSPGNDIGDAHEAGAQQNYWLLGNPEEKGKATPVGKAFPESCRATTARNTRFQGTDVADSVSIPEASKDRLEKHDLGKTVLIQRYACSARSTTNITFPTRSTFPPPLDSIGR